MSGYYEQARQAIQNVAAFLETSPWKNEFLSVVKEMLYAIDRDGTVAIAGRVKAGKSSLLNALLNDDQALVGTTETTATINKFLHTDRLPEKRLFSKETPILCRKRDGTSYWISREELDSFQGNDEKTLEKSLEIDGFEYYLENDYLKQITLVDTPGTGALVLEHQKVTERYWHLAETLRKKHSTETEMYSDKADAVIYLVGAVAKVDAKAFLDAFTDAGAKHGKAYNAIGVMAMIDKSEELLAVRKDRTREIAEQFRDELNTVVPVSAGLARTLVKLTQSNRLAEFQEQIRKIEPARLEHLLKNEELWLSSKCVLAPEVRASLSAGMPWSVFTVIAKRLHSLPLEEAVRELEDISGFAKLRKIIKDHFVARKHLLRCHRVIDDLDKIVRTLRGPKLFQYKENAAGLRRDFKAYRDFIASHPGRDSDVSNRLRRFLADHMDEDESPRLESELETIKAEIEAIQEELGRFHDHFAAIQKIESHPAIFSDEEKRELRNLFGMHPDSDEPPTREYVTSRQLFWKVVGGNSHGEQKDVAEIAVATYGNILYNMDHKQN